MAKVMDGASCKSRIGQHLRNRVRDLRTLWLLCQDNSEVSHPDLGRFDEYGLAFDYVSPGTFKNKRGYWRYQLSWGGPSDEFRFFTDENLLIIKVEYWFLDWYDGAHITLRGSTRGLLEELWEYWMDCGLPQRVKGIANG